MRTIFSLALVAILITGCGTTSDPLVVGDVADTTLEDTVQDDLAGDMGGDIGVECLCEVPDHQGDDILLIPQGCCFQGEVDCADDQQCVNTTGSAFGVCLPKPMSSSQCWQDSDCGEQGPCITQGPGFQPLLAGCGDVPAEPGMCKGMYTYCCFEQSDCPDLDGGGATVCVGLDHDEYGGTCMAAPVGNQCYADSDCAADHTCLGAAWCPCGFDCQMGYWGPGQCVPQGSDCCMHSAECANGMTCAGVDPDNGQPGVCRPTPAAGDCWNTSDCGESEYCQGAMICPCGAMCDMEDQLGTCMPLGTDCCFTDAMCEVGQTCVGAGPGGFAGACVDAAAAGSCWSDTDCEADHVCTGAEFHGCGAPSPMVPGSCQLAIPGCCLEDSDCEAGLTCAKKLPFLGGLCLPVPELGACWDDEDCPAGMCDGEWFCGCNEVCPMMGINTPGQCVYPVQMCVDGYVSDEGIGTPCPSGDPECLGLGANLCSSAIFNDATLPPFCTRWCNGTEPCPEGSFCIDKGWSSICVPDTCAAPTLASCLSESECLLATKQDECCACPQAVTQAAMAWDQCLIPSYTKPLVPIECMVDCTAVLCAECPTPTAATCEGNLCKTVP